MSREQKLEAAELVARLRAQHSDLQQGAYYGPNEDPKWDATLAAAEFIAALGEQEAAPSKIEQELNYWRAKAAEYAYIIEQESISMEELAESLGIGEQEATPPEPDVCPRCGCTKREMYREGCRRQDGPPHSWHRESVVEAESGDVERWPGTTERPWFVEGLTAMDRFRSRVILYVGDSDQDRADLALIVDAVNAYAPSPPSPPDELAQIIVRAAAPQGEPEPTRPEAYPAWVLLARRHDDRDHFILLCTAAAQGGTADDYGAAWDEAHAAPQGEGKP